MQNDIDPIGADVRYPMFAARLSANYPDTLQISGLILLGCDTKCPNPKIMDCAPHIAANVKDGDAQLLGRPVNLRLRGVDSGGQP